MGLECRLGLECWLGSWLGSGLGSRLGLECWLGLERWLGLECRLGLGSRLGSGLEQRLLLDRLGSAGGGSVLALSAEGVEPAVERNACTISAPRCHRVYRYEYGGRRRTGHRCSAARELP